jgi:hypothetical protein
MDLIINQVNFRRVRKTAKSDYRVLPVCLSVGQSVRLCLCVRMEQSAPSERIFMKFNILVFWGGICPENPRLIKIEQEKRLLCVKTNVQLW